MSDLLLRDVRIVPLAPGQLAPEPIDVLVRGGVVASVAPGVAAQGVQEVAGEGRWLIPGLWDQHLHAGQWALSQQRLDTSGVRSPEEAVALAGAEVAAAPGKPVIGMGHRPGGWTREPTVAELDEVSGVTPVVLIAGDCHHAWLNSAALAALGLGARDEVVRENEWFAAYSLLTELTDESGTSPGAYRSSFETMVAMGLVGVVDFEFSGGPMGWIERWDAGADVLRVRAATYADGLEEVIAAGLRTGMPLIEGDPRLTMGPLKIISDGSLNTRTAWCCEPYADLDIATQTVGAPNLPAHELQALLARAHMSGLEVATHAIGDAAVAAALDAYELTGARGSIEHAQLMRTPDIPRLASAGLRASVQPAHLLDDRDLSELIWADRTDRAFPFRGLLDAGTELVLGSDAPVAPCDPWLAMAAAVHRSGDDREPWWAGQAITPQEALASSVDGVEAVAPGVVGDLVLLDRDPLAGGDDSSAQAKWLREMSATVTVIAGEVVHDGR